MLGLSFVASLAFACLPPAVQQTGVLTPLGRPGHSTQPPRLPPSKISNATVPLGLPAGAWFGRSVAAIGDLDGNGFGDLVVGAPEDAQDGSNHKGAVYVLFLGAQRTVIAHRRIPSFGSSTWFGHALCPLGDLNGDGAVDFAVSDLEENAIWTVFLNPDGSVQSSVRISDALPPPIAGPVLDSYGEGLANLGDISGDGVIDIAIMCGLGADGYYPRTFGVALNANGTVRGYTDNGPSCCTNASGGSVPDMNGDGLRETLIGQPYAGPGRVELCFTLPTGLLGPCRFYDFTGLNSVPFGIAVAEAGDLDGNGVIDLAIGNRRAYFLLTLDPDGYELGRVRIGSPQGLPGLVQQGDGFGSSLAFLGDIDGDGRNELAIGTPYDDDGGVNSGAVWIASVQ